MVETNREARVDRVELRLRKPDHLAPDAEVLLVAGLQLHEFRARRVERGGIGFAALVLDFVDALQLGDRIEVERGAVEQRLPREAEHSELRAPVADVVVRDDGVAEETPDARERVAEDR